jgi:hypothetical protein
MRLNTGLLTQNISGTTMPMVRSAIVSSSEQYTHLTTQRFTTQTVFQVWTPKRGTHYCTPDDGHTSARNMLSE